MHRFLSFLLLCLLTLTTAFAQADRLVGNYLIDYEGKQSKVKIYKYENGYRAQNYWVREAMKPDGTVARDEKNPDMKKRNVAVSDIVLIDKVIYKDGIWTDGYIYDPTSGKSYRVEMKFNDDKTLELKGKLGPFFKRIYWKRIE